MTVLQAILLGLIQGLTEFLPVSSSGHLSIFQNFFGMQTAEDGSLLFDVLLHLGTLASVCAAYRRDIAEIVADCVGFVQTAGQRMAPGGEGRRFYGARVLLMMFFATLPLFLILPVHDYIERLYYSTVFIGLALILTGAMLYVSDRMARGRKTGKTMGIWDALLIGVCQAIATLPGLSRSGTTITAGIATGLDRRFAVKFSFLISIPAVLGANLLSLVKAFREGVDWASFPAYLLGMITAAVVGYFAIGLVQYLVKKDKFGYFAYYCAGVGVLTLLLSIIL